MITTPISLALVIIFFFFFDFQLSSTFDCQTFDDLSSLKN
uniref:Uncharacterized protein n=1 Tax=Rhizophora mucronata TaxID=61149 RepID=A0A2P2P531_RHIMU